MSHVSPNPIDYAAPQTMTGNASGGLCALCDQRPGRKRLYGHLVCKKCVYRFTNRRQIAYVLDLVFFIVPLMFLSMLMDRAIAGLTMSDGMLQLYNLSIGAMFTAVYLLRDGVGGGSPGKRLMGLRVIDDASGQPISFGQSFKRNAIFLIGIFPLLGPLASLVILVIVIVQMSKGYRLGDRFAGTRVIWKKYADSPVFGGNDKLCRGCGYDLTANESGLCPECGRPIVVGGIPTALPVSMT